jgi:two-component system response regulator NreC
MLPNESQKLRVLLCDDNDHFRQLLVQFLNSQNDAEVVGEAVDGIDVLYKAETLMPDVVLMDLSMPNQSGLDAAKTIKEKWPKIKVFILTLYEDNVYRELAEEFQADGFIAKSAIKTSLPQMIREKFLEKIEG